MQLMCALHLVMNLIMSETLTLCLHHSLAYCVIYSWSFNREVVDCVTNILEEISASIIRGKGRRERSFQIM